MDGKVFIALKKLKLTQPWIAVATLVKRMRADEGGYIISTMSQAIVWDPYRAVATRAKVTLPRLPLLDVCDYFEDNFELHNWTRVTLVFTVDGATSARGDGR